MTGITRGSRSAIGLTAAPTAPVLSFAPMAKISIGLGFVRTPDQEKELRKLAATLPDDWTIEMSGGPQGVNSPGIWDTRIFGPDLEMRKSFGPDGVDAAISMLQGLRLMPKPQPKPMKKP